MSCCEGTLASMVRRKLGKLLMPMPRLAVGQHVTVGYIQGSKQGGCAVAFVVVGDAF